MADLTVLVPSRGRPDKVTPLVEAFRATCTANTSLLFSIDTSDPTRLEYEAAGAAVLTADNRNMVEALNRAADYAATDPTGLSGVPFAIGFMGDDHMPRSVGWDTSYLRSLRDLGTGIVYGNDLLQRQNLPTQCAMTTDIVRALGWMAPPVLTHLYVDNFWRDLGAAAGCLRYLPDVIVEHRHPVAGKAQWDANYARVNNSTMYEKDADAYEQFVGNGQLHEAVDAVRTLRAAFHG